MNKYFSITILLLFQFTCVYKLQLTFGCNNEGALSGYYYLKHSTNHNLPHQNFREWTNFKRNLDNLFRKNQKFSCFSENFVVS